MTNETVCPLDGYQTVLQERYVSETERLVGQVFHDRYQVEECIGLGGMGAVYRATQLSVNRQVALKVLRPDFAPSLEQVGRFQREARAASVLEHPNTIRVYDFGQSDDGELYLALELLEGEPLSELLRRNGAIAPERVVRIGVQIAKSLSEAHTKGIVHRDLKPENVFLKKIHGEEDFVKVVDFGIAKVAERDGRTRSLTSTGTVVGTPLYMSPEQARGLEVGPSSDLYSFGAVLFELLTGEPPFDGNSAMEVMLAHVQEAPPTLPMRVRSDYPGLALLVQRLLEKQPDDRPASAAIVRQMLEQVESGGVEDAPWKPPLYEVDPDLLVPSSVTKETLRLIDNTEGRRSLLTWALVLITLVSVVLWHSFGSDEMLVPVGPRSIDEISQIHSSSAPVDAQPEARSSMSRSVQARGRLRSAERQLRRTLELAARSGTRHSSSARTPVKRKSARKAGAALRVKKQ